MLREDLLVYTFDDVCLVLERVLLSNPFPRRTTHPRPQGGVMFIVSGANQLCQPETADSIFETVAHRVDQSLWYPHVFLLMPDHVHALLSFPADGGMTAAIRAWKS